MMNLARHLPAWVLQCLPVQLARRCAQQQSSNASAPVAAPSAGTPAAQLLVDVSVIYASDSRTGIQRVVRSLLLQLLKTPPAGYIVCPIFATRQHGYRHAAPGFLERPPQAVDEAAEPVEVQRDDLFLGLDLAAHLLPRHQAQLLGWKKRGVKVHVLVYDLLPLQHPEWFNPKTTRNFKRWINWLAIYADSAICISETVQTELKAWLGAKFDLNADALPSSTIMLGADIDASGPSDGLPANADFLLARMRSTPAVLMVGTIEPRKGYEQALAAFELLWNHNNAATMLIVVGRPGWKTDALQTTLRNHPQAGKRMFWLDDASDEFLTRLYAASRGVLIATRAEGFGLPLVEATLHGKPVLARDLPVFQELKVPGVTYFKGHTPKELAAAVDKWLASIANGTRIESKLTTTTWEKTAISLLRTLGMEQGVATPAAGAGISSKTSLETAA
jgi:glycosyltransferase involved in cell wall biosynthesis